MKKLLLLLLATQVFSLKALDVNTKMGKPTNEELTMTSYAADPDAQAVMLFSETYVRYNIKADDFCIDTHNKRRVKILSADAISQADVEIVVYDEEDNNTSKERVSKLSGNTFNMENGKLVKTKLSADLKNSQRLDDYHVVYKFTMPNVQVGSILEYEWEVSSPFYSNIDDWYAQEEIPVFFTRYETLVPEYFHFNAQLTGTQSHLVKCTKTPDSFSAIYPGGDVLRCSAFKEVYEAKEMPRLEKVDYIWCDKDYKTRVSKELKALVVPGRITKSYNDKWSVVVGNLAGAKGFGNLRKNNDPLEEQVKAIKWPEDFGVKEKIDSLRNLLWANFKWTERYTLGGVTDRKLKKEGEGGSATLNFALLNMLKDAGVEEVYPVVFSKRSSGRLGFAPSLRDINCMTLTVWDPADSAFVYVDAGSKDYAVGTIPANFLVDRAIRINFDDKKYHDVDLRDKSKGSTLATITLNIDADGKLSGNVNKVYRNITAAEFRQQYRAEVDSIDILQHISAKYGVDVTSYTVNGNEASTESCSEIYDVTKQLEASGDMLYLNPFVGIDGTSPFTAEKRVLPVEFDCQETLRYVINIKVDDSYDIVEAPRSTSMAMDNDDLNASVKVRKSGNTLSITFRQNINTTFLPANQYEYLRGFYNGIEQTLNSQLVLKKKQQ